MEISYQMKSDLHLLERNCALLHWTNCLNWVVYLWETWRWWDQDHCWCVISLGTVHIRREDMKYALDLQDMRKYMEAMQSHGKISLRKMFIMWTTLRLWGLENYLSDSKNCGEARGDLFPDSGYDGGIPRRLLLINKCPIIWREGR